MKEDRSKRLDIWVAMSAPEVYISEREREIQLLIVLPSIICKYIGSRWMMVMDSEDEVYWERSSRGCGF